MPRRTLLTASALTAATALLLAGCGGHDDTKPQGSDQAASTQATTPSPSPTIARPKIPPLPADDQLSFEGRSASNATERAILSDHEQYIRAREDAILRRVKNSQAVSFYAKGQGLTDATNLINDYIQSGDTAKGLVRYFDWKTADNGNSASITYCADESKVRDTNLKTGKVTTASGKDAYVLYGARLAKNSDGVWQTISFSGKVGAAQCQP
ncbi:hypothetical protein [Streptomyces natalensis]|uniref:hypothetical protein n=1 Tax=Streptomyces natalensis TaxID=68242 RepID=UPI00068BD56D|nr:hypothetical protein [Streptomyces natalensis]